MAADTDFIKDGSCNTNGSCDTERRNQKAHAQLIETYHNTFLQLGRKAKELKEKSQELSDSEQSENALLNYQFYGECLTKLQSDVKKIKRFHPQKIGVLTEIMELSLKALNNASEEDYQQLTGLAEEVNYKKIALGFKSVAVTLMAITLIISALALSPVLHSPFIACITFLLGSILSTGLCCLGDQHPDIGVVNEEMFHGFEFTSSADADASVNDDSLEDAGEEARNGDVSQSSVEESDDSALYLAHA